MKAGTILDSRGKPVELKQLEQELANSITAVRGTEFDSAADKLTPSKLAGILNDIQEDADPFLTLAVEMEEREPHYGSVLSTRKLAVSGIEPVVEAASEETADTDLADEIRALIKKPNFVDLVEDLLDGLGKGYAVAEIMWDRGPNVWVPSAYNYKDPRWFKFDYKDGEELRLKDPEDKDGIPLAPFKFIVHYPRLRSGLKIRGGLARLACVSYMCKNYTLKDWMRFIELYGQPMRLGRYDSTASDRDKEILKRAVTMLGVNAAAILPKGMEIDFTEISNVSAGATLFEKMANWLDKQISKAVLGQTMTSDDGSSQSQATVHNEVRGDILKADARRLAATLNEQLVKAYIDLNHGVQEAYPEIKFPVEDPEDLVAWTKNVGEMVDRGLKVPQKHVRDKLNLPDPEGDEELLMPPASATPDSAGPALNTQRGTALNRREEDDLDEILAEAMDGWEAVEDETFAPLRQQVLACNSYEEIKAVLDDHDMNADTMVQALATAMHKARGSADHD